MLGFRPHAAREPEPPETEDRRCPCCAYHRITADGLVTFGHRKVKERFRCELCGRRFVFVRQESG
jgi:hypothetical protein